MADPLIRADLRWENALAAISLAGIRPLTIASSSVGASS